MGRDDGWSRACVSPPRGDTLGNCSAEGGRTPGLMVTWAWIAGCQIEEKRLDSSPSYGTTLCELQPRNVVSGSEARGENSFNCWKHDEPVKNT